MPEKCIRFPSGPLMLEGLFDARPENRAVIVTHPHPLFGGDMHNNVVQALVEVYGTLGYSTLRFNFRGVGASEGRFDNGLGEQDDVQSAYNYVSDFDNTAIDVVGYSFGAWINARALERLTEAARFIFVAPPVAYMGLDFLTYSPKIRLVVVGSRDEIAGVSAVEENAMIWNPEATVRRIEGADHFYFGKTEELKTVVRDFLLGS